VARTPLILLPPSEGKAPGGTGAPWSPGRGPDDELDGPRTQVLDALVAAMAAPESARAKLLGVKGDALAAATAANQAVRSAPTRPAIERYTGVLYDALDWASLDATARRRGTAQIRIVSGLWGLVAPRTPIPDYKLKMGASLAGVGRLASFWKPHLTSVLAGGARGRTVWDLLPNEHAAAWDPAAALPRRRITVRFVDDVGTGRARKQVTVAHWNKLLKGALVRHVLATQLDEPDGLADFTHPEGYVYRPELTEERDGLTRVTMVARR